MTVTHKRAPWVLPIFEYNRPLEYPGQEVDGLEAIVEKYPGFRFEQASMSTRLNWTRDVIDLFDEFQIDRAYWTYRDLDFGLLDKQSC